MESLPHDILSKDFEAEPWKYSSFMDFTTEAGTFRVALSVLWMYTSVFFNVLFYVSLCLQGPAIANFEGALVFSPKSFLPRSTMANVTVHLLGRSFNLLEVTK